MEKQVSEPTGRNCVAQGSLVHASRKATGEVPRLLSRALSLPSVVVTIAGAVIGCSTTDTTSVQANCGPGTVLAGGTCVVDDIAVPDSAGVRRVETVSGGDDEGTETLEPEGADFGAD